MTAPPDLRMRLRADTRDAHDRVDAAYGRLDPARGPDLARLLGSLAGALAALAPRPGDGHARAAALLREARGALGADLGSLGAPAPAAPAALCAGPLALRYVLLGSRAGTRLMARRWAAAADARAAAAGRYLSLDPRPADWRALCRDLARRPAEGAAAEALLAEVRAVFGVFGAAHDLNAARPAGARPHPCGQIAHA